jgi:hypothetical protein
MKGIYWRTLNFKKSVIYLIKVNYTGGPVSNDEFLDASFFFRLLSIKFTLFFVNHDNVQLVTFALSDHG